jgi:hypothetical protein
MKRVPSNSRVRAFASIAERARYPDLKQSTRAILPRLPATLLNRVNIAANKRDVSYRLLIKMWLSEQAERSRGGSHGVVG